MKSDAITLFVKNVLQGQMNTKFVNSENGEEEILLITKQMSKFMPYGFSSNNVIITLRSFVCDVHNCDVQSSDQ